MADFDDYTGLQLRIGYTDDGRMMAVAYEKKGDDIHVQDVEIVANEAEAHTWFEKVKVERPWEERH